MPQMAPMNWTLLFMIFISLYLVSLIMIYFTPNNSDQDSSTVDLNTLNENNLTWKW